MRTRVALAGCIALMASTLGTALPAYAAPGASDISKAGFETTVPPADSPKGVSPEVYYDLSTSTYYLLTTSMPPTQYRSSDGVNWSAVGNTLPMGLDWSIVQEGPSAYRLYYAEMAPTAQGSGPPKPCAPRSKYLRYATSTDLVTWTPQPGVLLDDVGCGVPHVMKTRDGRYFLYFNKQDTKHGVRVATSNDGLSWSERPGIIADTEDLVDPAPIEMPDGTFIMIASTLGGPKSGGLQELQILGSTDAINWQLRPQKLYSAPGASALDPSVEYIDGKMRVWYGYAPNGDHNNSRIAYGTVTFDGSGQQPNTATVTKPSPGDTCTKSGAKSGKLVCKKRKGELMWVPKRFAAKRG
jgi:hypothetical protein